MDLRNHIGDLVIANPSNPKDQYDKSVFLVTNYTENYVISLQINRVKEETDLASVSQDLGVNYYRTDPIYDAGGYNPNKIHVVHSLDWRGIGTVPITKNIGITHDISILYALANNEGPEFYKACAGHDQWNTQTFIGQLSKKKIAGVPHKWEILPATIENVFCIEDDLLWEHCIETAIIKRVKDFF